MINARFSAPCLDKYPPGKHFNTDEDLLEMARHRLRDSKLRSSKSDIHKEFTKLRASFLVANIWKPENFPTLNIAFLDGSDKQKTWVKHIVQTRLEPMMSKIKFNWDTDIESSHIRISFALPNQAWSMIGTDALRVPKNRPTMNLGWLDDDTQYDVSKLKGTGMVVLHEFGHAIGMIHEHQNPNGNPIVWNKPVVYADLARTNGWNQAMVDANMFKKYGDYELCKKAQEESGPERTMNVKNYCEGELVNGSHYDPTSIMHYFFPQTWIKEGPESLVVNREYSSLDEEWIRKYYGHAKKATKEDIEDGIKDEIKKTLNKGRSVNNTMYYLYFAGFTVVALVVFLAILYLVFRLLQQDKLPTTIESAYIPTDGRYM